MRIVILGTALLTIGAAWVAPFDQTQAQFEEVLSAHVKDGLVDYASLKRNRDALDRYIDQTSGVSEQTFGEWTKDEQLAFLINVYNAETLQLIIDHYPVDSIKDIGSFLRGPWEQKSVRLFGEETTLDHVEHELIRKRFDEPRIHFALVCAAKGCPPLSGRAYTGEKLDEQLAERARLFLGDPAKNRLDKDAGVLYLSPIFKWYGDDFGDSIDERIARIAGYMPSADEDWLADHPVRIRYTDYDWSLNER